MKILYIEDNKDLADCVTEMLEGAGHAVNWIADRRFLPEDISSFDFVLSDFDVPGGDFSRTKELCVKFQKPLLLVSGNVNVEQLHSHVIAKPFSNKELISTITKLSEGKLI